MIRTHFFTLLLLTAPLFSTPTTSDEPVKIIPRECYYISAGFLAVAIAMEGGAYYTGKIANASDSTLIRIPCGCLSACLGLTGLAVAYTGKTLFCVGREIQEIEEKKQLKKSRHSSKAVPIEAAATVQEMSNPQRKKHTSFDVEEFGERMFINFYL